MRKIFKYPFEVARSFLLQLPRQREVIHVECQDNTPCIWAIVDPESALEEVEFRVYGTGWPIEEKVYDLLCHQGTFQQGPSVWHLFQVLKESER